jgi:uncharacterized protein (DUF1810 family)
MYRICPEPDGQDRKPDFSSMALFGTVSSRSIFQTALDQFYKGVQDGSTLAILAKWTP